jgi:hypothetical protein
MKPWHLLIVPAIFLTGALRIGMAVYEHKMEPKWANIEQSLPLYDALAYRKTAAPVSGHTRDIERVRKIANVQKDVKITRIENAHAYQLNKDGQTIVIVVGD